MTIKKMFTDTVKRCGKRPFLRFKRNGEWEELSYEQTETRIRQVSQLLHEFGLSTGDHVALFADNSKEWIEIYLGIVSLGISCVPLDPKLREQEVTHILHDSESKVLFTTARNYALVRDIETKLPDLRCVVLVNGLKLLPAEKTDIRFEDYETMLSSVSEAAAAEDSAFNTTHPEEDSIASLIYTSGTTGRPKGAMLTHRNFVSDVISSLSCFTNVTIEDNFLLVLPLHHAFAFTACLLIPLYLGCSISLVESLKTIAENMRETKPSVLIGVPLLVEKMLNKINAGINQKRHARIMMRIGLGKIVGKKVLDKLGGNLRVVVCGGAPCDAQIINGWAKLGLLVREGYGLTEAAPVLTLNPPERNKPGTVGKALPGIELKLLNVNENDVGEIAAKGDNIMLGYYKNQAATDDVIKDGWLLTGDLGHFDSDGYLTISGRKKSLIVNREGKNIYPEEVESQILRSSFILEALVLGYRESDEKTGEKVGAIIIPDQEAILQEHPDFTDEQIDQFVQQEVRDVTSALSNYKRPRCIQVRFEEFQKTSTQKVKRYLYAINTSNL